ncbi:MULTISPECIES: hypothetical protein [Rhizobium]|uniref:hypothetical protein n=1 Tax=Rhizobium TaxID=379 RepID=UPI00142892EC|nr:MULTISPECIES: hypothetical protein [Rhizobium]
MVVFSKRGARSATVAMNIPPAQARSAPRRVGLYGFSGDRGWLGRYSSGGRLVDLAQAGRQSQPSFISIGTDLVRFILRRSNLRDFPPLMGSFISQSVTIIAYRRRYVKTAMENRRGRDYSCGD